ncbi:hypothetical protein M0812_26871 [Anaeramoeba flamelloides]|uniref:Uncharacterized protein n=1 Tax=Anaeramoeba flamelloides TaxID=1746091 RepID=A0AAV7YBS8_9EUKA|nr:hypothetical protein M0812_26871 [Anaeramoeba flamelloides]
MSLLNNYSDSSSSGSSDLSSDSNESDSENVIKSDLFSALQAPKNVLKKTPLVEQIKKEKENEQKKERENGKKNPNPFDNLPKPKKAQPHQEKDPFSLPKPKSRKANSDEDLGDLNDLLSLNQNNANGNQNSLNTSIFDKLLESSDSSDEDSEESSEDEKELKPKLTTLKENKSIQSNAGNSQNTLVQDKGYLEEKKATNQKKETKETNPRKRPINEDQTNQKQTNQQQTNPNKVAKTNVKVVQKQPNPEMVLNYLYQQLSMLYQYNLPYDQLMKQQTALEEQIKQVQQQIMEKNKNQNSQKQPSRIQQQRQMGQRQQQFQQQQTKESVVKIEGINKTVKVKEIAQRDFTKDPKFQVNQLKSKHKVKLLNIHCPSKKPSKRQKKRNQLTSLLLKGYEYSEKMSNEKNSRNKNQKRGRQKNPYGF